MKYPIILAALLLVTGAGNAQNTMKPAKGYAPQIGTTVMMLEDLKRRVTNSVVNLDQASTDFLLDDDANRIGAMILHLAATEAYYQVFTFEGRGFNREEAAQWDLALSLGAPARRELVGKPINHYLDTWEEVRRKTLQLLKTKEDKWFARKVAGSSMNNHWAWYHVMEHQANHLGQIRLIAKRAS